MIEFLRRLFSLSPKRVLGAVPNPLDLRDIQLAAFEKPVEVPYSYETDISMIPVTNQLSHGSCVGQAEGTIIAYFDYLENKNVDVSRRYIYAKAKQLDGLYEIQGTYPRTGASVIEKNGAPTGFSCPDDNSLPYGEYLSIKEVVSLVADAAKRKAKYAFIARNKEAIKQAIFTKKLVSVSLAVDWSAWPLNGGLTKPNPGKIAGWHRIVLYGFDGDVMLGRNSWGKDWGQSGNLRFRYDDYADFLLDPIVYTDIPNEILEDVKKQTYTFTRTLRIGMSGPDVVELQAFLGVTPRTGYFGNITKQRLIRFQLANGLAGDGIAGPKTFEKINKPMYLLTPLEAAIIKVESGGDLYAIGDKHLKDRAYGCMQIRRPCVADVNKALGTDIKPEQTLGNLNLSIFIFREYQKIYNPEGTEEEKSRTWNGGPGWRKNPILTDKYWSAVKRLLS